MKELCCFCACTCSTLRDCVREFFAIKKTMWGCHVDSFEEERSEEEGLIWKISHGIVCKQE